jgi:hypothetical protein
VDVEPTLVADGEPAKLPQPGQRALDDPAVAPEPVTRLDADARETAADVVALTVASAVRLVVALVAVQLRRPAARMSTPVVR